MFLNLWKMVTNRKSFTQIFRGRSIKWIMSYLHQLDCEYMPLKWIGSYLTGRTQRVRIDDYESVSFRVHSGVPQGSHLGPFLFNLFINDVISCFSFAKVLLYADDLKIYATIQSQYDAIALQRDLNVFCSWTNDNKLLLNVPKCKIISFNKKRDRLSFSYTIYDKELERVNSIKDLGVIFTSNLTFNLHIDHIISKASSMLGMIKRFSYDFYDPYTIKTLYVSFVRSNLEYASVIWSPSYNVHSERIESIQKKFLVFVLRRLPSNNDRSNFVMEPYINRLNLLNLQELKARREITLAMFARDIICSKIDCPTLLSVINFYVPSRALRPRRYGVQIPLSRTNYGSDEPIFNSLRSFNHYFNLFDYNMSRQSFKLMISK